MIIAFRFSYTFSRLISFESYMTMVTLNAIGCIDVAVADANAVDDKSIAFDSLKTSCHLSLSLSCWMQHVFLLPTAKAKDSNKRQ